MEKVLLPNELVVIKEMYFKEVPSTLEDITKILKRSMSAVRHLHTKGLKRLENHFKVHNLIA